MYLLFFDWVNGLRGNPIRKCIPQICCGRKGICANPGLKRAKSSFLVGEGSMQVFIAEDNYYELERLRRQVQSWGSRHGGVSITAVQCVAEVGPADLRTYDAVFLDVELPGKDGFAFAQELRGAGC